MFSASVKGGKKWKEKIVKLKGFKPVLEVGILASDGATTTEGESVATYATYNEYGTPTIPARPFMRQTEAARVGTWKNIVRKRASSDPDDIIGAFELAGEVAAKDIQATIEAGGFVANAESTIEAKKRRNKKYTETPLIDDGTMQEAMNYRVIKQ